MRILTVREPWAWAIAEGHKLLENRTWSTSYRGPLAIHSGKKKPTIDDCEFVELLCRTRDLIGDEVDVRARALEQLGCIVAVCELLNISPAYQSMDQFLEAGHGEGRLSWAAYSQHHWILGEVRRLPEPIPVTGKLGLWRPDAAVTAELRRQTG